MGFKSVNGSNGTKPKGSPPALTLRASGGIKVSCWQNEHKGNDGKLFTTFNAVPARGYYDDEKKEWKDTDSLRESDLLPMAELLRSLWTEIQKAKTAKGESANEPTGGDGFARNADGTPAY